MANYSQDDEGTKESSIFAVWTLNPKQLKRDIGQDDNVASMSVTKLKVLEKQITARGLVPLQACNHGTMVDAAWNGTRSIRTCKSSATQIVQHCPTWLKKFLLTYLGQQVGEGQRLDTCNCGVANRTLSLSGLLSFFLLLPLFPFPRICRNLWEDVWEILA